MIRIIDWELIIKRVEDNEVIYGPVLGEFYLLEKKVMEMRRSETPLDQFPEKEKHIFNAYIYRIYDDGRKFIDRIYPGVCFRATNCVGILWQNETRLLDLVDFKLMPEFGGALWESKSGIGTTLSAYLPLSRELQKLEEDIEEWNDEYASAVEPAEINYIYDWNLFNNRGIELAIKIKQFLGNEHKVFFWKAYEDPSSTEGGIKEIES